MPIYKALLKHGYSNFTLEILEYCDQSAVINREQYYLDRFKGEYNILSQAGTSMGYQHSEASRQKMREKMREAWLDTARREAARTATTAATAACSKAVLATNIETGETVEYVSRVAAAKALGVSKTTILNQIKSGKP